jgi:predicted enzyme related to lactoylglutathione lyase
VGLATLSARLAHAGAVVRFSADGGETPPLQEVVCARGNAPMGTSLKSICAIRIFVSDLDRARRFFRDALELDETSAGPEWAVFDIDGCDIVLETVAADDPDRGLVGRLMAVSFTVDGIDVAYRNLVARGVSFPMPPEVQPWGGILAFPRDPDGNILTLVGRRSL